MSDYVDRLQKEKQLSINIFLTEKVLGKCWHEPLKNNLFYQCRHCLSQEKNIDLFTPSGFFLLWEEAQEEEWFWKFLHESYMKQCEVISTTEHLVRIINLLTFPTLLAEYLGWKP